MLFIPPKPPPSVSIKPLNNSPKTKRLFCRVYHQQWPVVDGGTVLLGDDVYRSSPRTPAGLGPCLDGTQHPVLEFIDSNRKDFDHGHQPYI